MNYKKIHDNIIERARKRDQLEGYTERHHIIPKCMGGLNDKENLVDLSAREHFIVHKLLCEIYPEESGLKYAVWYMANVGKNDMYNISAREYERLRKEQAYLNSKENLTKEQLRARGQAYNNWLEGASDKEIEERNRKISLAMTGKENPTKRLEVRNKISESKKGTIIAKDDKGNYHAVCDDDVRLLNGDLIPSSKNMVICKDLNNLHLGIFQVTKEEFDNNDNLVGHSYGEKRPCISEEHKKKISEANSGKAHHSSKKTLHVETGKMFYTQTEAANYFGLATSTVSAHCKGKFKTQKFKYIEE